MTELTIGGLARAGGTSVETVRYYQRRGLLGTPEREPNPGLNGTIRRYGDGHVRRLRFIRGAQAAGFTLKQIAELIALEATDDRAGARILARERIAALDAKLLELKRARDRLSRLAATCAATHAGPCPIFHAFEDLQADCAGVSRRSAPGP